MLTDCVVGPPKEDVPVAGIVQLTVPLEVTLIDPINCHVFPDAYPCAKLPDPFGDEYENVALPKNVELNPDFSQNSTVLPVSRIRMVPEAPVALS
jgi:hypothetical protein